MTWRRWALLCVGIAQIALGTVQGFGLDVGLTHQHPTGAGTHLLNESTSWSIALGVIMVGAALWPSAAAGLAGVLTAFVAILTGYVIVDALSGAVRTGKSLSRVAWIAPRAPRNSHTAHAASANTNARTSRSTPSARMMMA